MNPHLKYLPCRVLLYYLLVTEPVGVQMRQEKVAQILLVEGGQGAGVGLAQVPQEIHGLHEDLGLGVDAALHLELRRGGALFLGRGPSRPEGVCEQRAEGRHHVLLDHLVAGVRRDEREVPEGAGRRVHDRGRGAAEIIVTSSISRFRYVIRAYRII